MSVNVDFEPIYRDDMHRRGLVGIAFTVDGTYQWAPQPDPIQLLRVGDWLASNEDSLQHYTTTRQYGGFVVLFKSEKDLRSLWEWLVAGYSTPKPKWPQHEWFQVEDKCGTPGIDEQKAFMRRHKRRTKYNQLPGHGDRAWSAPFNGSVLSKLRFQFQSPFWKYDKGLIYVPVTKMHSMVLAR